MDTNRCGPGIAHVAEIYKDGRCEAWNDVRNVSERAAVQLISAIIPSASLAEVVNAAFQASPSHQCDRASTSCEGKSLWTLVVLDRVPDSYTWSRK